MENMLTESQPLLNKEVKLVDIPITDENTALNVIVSFLAQAQKKGVFTFDESAKIWECIQMFQKPASS
jgi:L-rhamnose isomerase